MKTIYKYSIGYTETITVPKGSKILSVINQHESICVYARVDTETKDKDQYSFKVYGTGCSIDCDDSYNFLGTVVMFEGNYIYHVFYKKM